VIDSQSVRASDWVSRATKGYAAAKKVHGRKRHVAVDTGGLLLEVLVTPASTQDRDGEPAAAVAPPPPLPDPPAGLGGCRLCRQAGHLGPTGPHPDAPDRPQRQGVHHFEVLPRRWVVERTFSWVGKYRRLAVDYERKPKHHQAWV